MENKEHIIQVEENIVLNIVDVESSETMKHMVEQVFNQDEYNIRKMNFEDGDVVVDIGANVGSVSLYIAKKYPNVKIYSFEAHPINYKNLIRNIESNNITNIVAHNLAVSHADNELINITLSPNNTGSSSIFKSSKTDSELLNFEVNTICLDTIISTNNIKKIKFLKIDCEGSEFDILENFKQIDSVEVVNMSVEIHTFMESRGKNVNSLVELCDKISTNKPTCKIYNLG
jgi:FkbM family methyltransferase